MVRNYFVVMLRIFLRNKFQTIITVLGLTVALAFSLFVGVFVAGEFEVNKSLPGVDRLFLVRSQVNGEESTLDFFSPALLPALANEQFPSRVTGYYRFWDRSITVSKGDKHFRIQSMIGDPTFLDVFKFTVLHGDARNPLAEPNSVIVTENAAKMFFNRSNVAGETLAISTEQNGVREYVINAVISEPDQKNTVTDLMDMNAQIFLSLANAPDFYEVSSQYSWQDNMISYIRLDDAGSREEAREMLNQILQKNAPKEISENQVIEISPIADYYLLTNHGAVLKLVMSLVVIIVFIMILAVTNFVNISVASSFSRLKEVGIRKVVGGGRAQLVRQFLSESVFLSLVSVSFSLIIYESFSGVFSSMLNTNLPSVMNFKPAYWLGLAGLPFLIGLAAGMYPAIFQSGSKPIESLKGKAKSVQGTISFSRVLVTVQYVITVFILVASIVLSRQTAFFLEHDLGYDKSHVLTVSSVPRVWTDEGFQRTDVAKQVFLRSSKVASVTLSWGAPGWGLGGFENKLYKEGDPETSAVTVQLTGADENFDDVYGLKLLEGSFLEQGSVKKNSKLTLNKSAADALNAGVGEKLRVDGSDNIFTVAGIVDDFHYESMREAVRPVAFMDNRDFESYRFFSFRMQPGNTAASVNEVQRVWREAFPDEPFNFFFADEMLQKQYSTELQLKKAANVASVLMLVIIMTGILGLVSLSVSKRNKEVGIRKALGATVTGILIMFSKEYVKLIFISFLVSLPLAFYFANQWLDNFAYHISLDWWMFVLPGLCLLLTTIILVSIQSYATATTNPVKSLRYE